MMKGVLRNFAKFTGKHLCKSLFFNKVAGLICNFIKKETPTQVFSCEFCEISKNTFFTEQVWATASGWTGSIINTKLEERQDKSITTKDLLQMAKFVLKNNFFESNSKIEQQICCTAIAPSYGASLWIS